MSYKLTRPCVECPSRTDVPPYLTAARVREIERGLVRGEFSCHETVDYDRWEDDDEGEPQYNPSGEEEHCAGALILLEKLGRPSQMMRISERLRNKDGSPMYDARKLDMDAPVFDSFEEMDAAQVRTRYKPRRKRAASPGASKMSGAS
jgi:hypothetical protein